MKTFNANDMLAAAGIGFVFGIMAITIMADSWAIPDIRGNIALRSCQQMHFTEGRYVEATGKIECRNSQAWEPLR